MASTRMTVGSKLGKGVPPGPRGYPVVGINPDVRKDPLAYILQMQRDYGDVVRYPRFGGYGYLVSHPDDIQYILQDNHRNFIKKKNRSSRLPILLGNGLLLSDGDFWRRQRRLAQPAFHRQRIASFAEIMTSYTEAMLEQWAAQGGQILDIAQEMTHLTLRLAGKTLFGLDLSQEASGVRSAFGQVTQEIPYPSGYILRKSLLPWIAWREPRSPSFDQGLNYLEEVVQGIIRQRRETGQDQGDLLSMFMLAKDEETGEQMDDRQLRDEVMTMMLAGHETTSTALSWTWYLLSQHPEEERKLHAELSSVLSGRAPTFENISHLPYTRMILEESMRLYPPAPSFNRQTVVEDRLGGYHIPAGAHIVIAPYVVHRHLSFWNDPELFRPERFAPEQDQKRPRYAYLPFSGGPRMCIGSNFALAEATLVLATVAQRYQLRLEPGHRVVMDPHITLRMKYGLDMELIPR